ncbi:hypothetical protein [uncultured Bacteroides sp.]|uniref:hypothetical protein n=1 Tax=uncultured Bacteroides sp. TaxID=162156 RepID=UPI002633A0AC|nr:hypothetical protein [uncultured Bacteroides sp.]
MNKLKFFFCTLGFYVCISTALAAMEQNPVKPFVGKWELWDGDYYANLEMDLYGPPTTSDKIYGIFSDYYQDTGVAYHIINVVSIQDNVAELSVRDDLGREHKARLVYDPASGRMSFMVSGSKEPVVFKSEDKFGFVSLDYKKKVEVYDAPVQGKLLMQADRGRAFKYLGKEKGWFKIGWQDGGMKIGYVSPQYAVYLKKNEIPEEMFQYTYSNGPVSLDFQRKGNKIIMTHTTMRIRPDGGILPALITNYVGTVKGNAVVFTQIYSGFDMEFNEADMTTITPYVIYYYKNYNAFLVEGEFFKKEDWQ